MRRFIIDGPVGDHEEGYVTYFSTVWFLVTVMLEASLIEASLIILPGQ